MRILRARSARPSVSELGSGSRRGFAATGEGTESPRRSCRARVVAGAASVPVQPGADVLGLESEGLADALERERPLTVVAREPRDDLAQALGGYPVPGRQGLQVEVDRVPENPQHQPMRSRFAGAAAG